MDLFSATPEVLKPYGLRIILTNTKRKALAKESRSWNFIKPAEGNKLMKDVYSAVYMNIMAISLATGNGAWPAL